MGNRYWKMSAAQKVGFATTMNTILTGPGGAAYGVTTDQKAALSAGIDNLSGTSQQAEDAKAAYHAKIQAKLASDLELTDAISSIAKAVYANPAVNDAMLAIVGLEPRPETRTKRPPVAPVNLQVDPNSDGTVKLKWNKNGNAVPTIFQVQQRTATGWEIVASVTSGKTTLTGFVPGVTTTFRVVASRLGQTSAPSNAITIYSEGAVSFKLKAA